MTNYNGHYIQCDVCGKRYSTDEDILEVNEFLHINYRGGYCPAFGDGKTYTCDVCPYCLNRMLGKYMRESDSDRNFISFTANLLA